MKLNTLTNIQKIMILGVCCFLTFNLSAQEDTESGFLSNLEISGSVDTYFRTNFNGLNKDEYDGNGDLIPKAPASSFANDPGFAIGMANAILSYEGEKVGFVADLVFGPRGEDAVFASGPSNNIVNQLYAYWNVSDAVTLTMGNFNTFLGYEVISPVANFNYSTSYMFSYGPFSHTGIKADFAIDDNWSAMLGVMNPTDYTEYNPFGKYSFGGQLGYSNDNGSAFLNVLYGEQMPTSDEALFQVDLTTGWNLSELFYLGLNTTYNATDGEGFYGAALYPQVNTSENFALGLRAEYFKELEDGGPVYGADATTMAYTLTGSYSVGNLILKPELRLDSVSDTPDPVFFNSDLERNDNLSSFVLAAIYSF